MVDKIKDHFKAMGKEATVKYIDPSYIIRSVPANSEDSYMCSILAQVKAVQQPYSTAAVQRCRLTTALAALALPVALQAAVHGSMAGFTGFSVGLVNNHSVMIPIPALVAKVPLLVLLPPRSRRVPTVPC